MKNEKLNRSAFPAVNQYGLIQPGMTKLEEFSASAMQGILSNPHLVENIINGNYKYKDYKDLSFVDIVSRLAIDHATSLLEKLNPSPETTV